MNQYNDHSQSEKDEALEGSIEGVELTPKKKNLSTIIIIEIILFVVVLVLAIIFFSTRGNLSFFNFTKNVEPSSSDSVQVETGLTDPVSPGSSGTNLETVVGDEDVSRPSFGEETVVESQRLTLPVPDQSVVSPEDAIPPGAIVLEALESGFSPAEFKVSRGELITLALTSRIDHPYTLTFYEESMPAISIGLGPYETRWISFKTPEISGEYQFRNDIFGKTNQRGKMIVE